MLDLAYLLFRAVFHEWPHQCGALLPRGSCNICSLSQVKWAARSSLASLVWPSHTRMSLS
jgi:hypothetical protein